MFRSVVPNMRWTGRAVVLLGAMATALLVVTSITIVALLLIAVGCAGSGQQQEEAAKRRVIPIHTMERISPDEIRNGKIAFDLHDEAAPILQDPEGGAWANRISGP